MTEEQISIFFRKSINILFVSNPRGTSIGVLIGVVLDGIIGLFSPVLKTIEIIDISKIKIWHLMGFSVVGMNIPSYLKRNDIPEVILNGMKLIEEQKRNKTIPDWQAGQMYSNLLQKMLESVELNIREMNVENRINDLVKTNQNDRADNVVNTEQSTS